MPEAFDADRVGVAGIPDLLMMPGAEGHDPPPAAGDAAAMDAGGDVVNRGSSSADQAGHSGDPTDMPSLSRIRARACLGLGTLVLDAAIVSPCPLTLPLQRRFALEHRLFR